jgi:hypothetical protein
MAGDPNGTPHRKRPGNVRITPRDLSILASIAENQFLTTSQIGGLHFPSIHRTRKRLRQLHESKFIAKLKIPPGLETLSPDSVHAVSRRGLSLLQLRGMVHEGIAVPKISRRPGTLLFLSHTLLRNSFRIALENAIKTHPDIYLNNWSHDNTITKHVALPDSKTQSLRRVALKADALFKLRHQSNEIEFFLEVDNGTMALTRLSTKMNAYYKWHLTERQKTSRKSISRYFLVLTFSERRAGNLVERLAINEVTGQNNRPWLVAHVERSELIQTNVLTGLHWYQPTLSEPRDVTLDSLLV